MTGSPGPRACQGQIFVTVEGIEGVGKSSVLASLRATLQARRHRVVDQITTNWFGWSEPLGCVMRTHRRHQVRLTGHSARVGTCVELLENGSSLAAVMLAGGWKGVQMVMQYGKGAMAGTNAVAALRKQQRKYRGAPDAGPTL